LLKHKDRSYLFCTVSGIRFCLNGDKKVERLNGATANLWYISKEFVKKINRQ
jgi:hypothetical protein